MNHPTIISSTSNSSLSSLEDEIHPLPQAGEEAPGLFAGSPVQVAPHPNGVVIPEITPSTTPSATPVLGIETPPPFPHTVIANPLPLDVPAPYRTPIKAAQVGLPTAPPAPLLGKRGYEEGSDINTTTNSAESDNESSSDSEDFSKQVRKALKRNPYFEFDGTEAHPFNFRPPSPPPPGGHQGIEV